MPEAIFDVAVPLRIAGSFHYKSEDPEIGLGTLVEVPFGNRRMHGYVLGKVDKSDIPENRLKAIESVLMTEPAFDAEMLRFLKWVAQYYCHPLGEVLATAIPRHVFAKRKPYLAKEKSFLPQQKPELTEEQAAALLAIEKLEPGKPVLLQGVTGSGKTEIYMRCLERSLDEGKGAIVLVPEIALTPQLVGRFTERFGDSVAVLHSDLSERERSRHWHRARTGEARLVVGARSAVFAPVHNLGTIIVDEEHEGSFKQEDSFRYHARDVAIVRAKLVGARAILGTATPSLESYHNAKAGKYAHVRLLKRVHQRPLPATIFVDLKDKEKQYSRELPWLSTVLVDKIGQTLTAGRQSLLYLNRLGFAHFLFCHDCGHTWRCENCDVALTYYKHPPQLKCHYCSATHRSPNQCEKCEGINLQTMGFGTELVEKTIAEIFPKARIGRMDRSNLKTHKALEELLESVARREVDIVVGTQMIAKGHDFPGVSLVGVLVADSQLNLPDFRAHERTFQIITQVAGRAGRAEDPGEVVIQTLNPEHPVLLAAAENRPDDFYRWELGTRQQFGFPPSRRLAMLRFQHVNQKQVERYAQEMTGALKDRIQALGYDCQVLGPAEAPISRIKKLYRYQALVKASGAGELQNLMSELLLFDAQRKTPVQMSVDVDPIHAL